MIAAGLYIRLSREDDRDGPSESIHNQQALLQAYARDHDFPVYDCYIDDGWSGTSFDRPGFQRLLSDIEAGRVNLVLTKDLSRLGRDYILTGHYLERYFPAHGVRYISLLDGVDTGTETAANDITPFRAILNDWYAKDISRKIKSVKRDKQRRGLFIGGKAPYGYRLDPDVQNHLIPDPEAARVVQRLFTLAAGGTSCRALALLLNKESVPSPAVYAGLANCGRGLWSSERISELLQNQVYAGTLVQGRRQRLSYKSKVCVHRPRDQWVLVPGTHAPLVEQSLFDAVQRQLDRRRTTRVRTYDDSFRGLLRCPVCGKPLGLINRPGTAGDRLYFYCRTCGGRVLRTDRVHDAVTDALTRLCQPVFSSPAFRASALALISRELERLSPAAALQKDLQQQRRTLDRLYADRLSGLLDEADFQRLYAAAKARRDRCLQALETLPAADPPALLDRFCRIFPQKAALLTAISPSADGSLLLHLRCRAPADPANPPVHP